MCFLCTKINLKVSDELLLQAVSVLNVEEERQAHKANMTGMNKKKWNPKNKGQKGGFSRPSGKQHGKKSGSKGKVK